jgi:hypothetical protein
MDWTLLWTALDTPTMKIAFLTTAECTDKTSILSKFLLQDGPTTMSIFMNFLFSVWSKLYIYIYETWTCNHWERHSVSTRDVQKRNFNWNMSLITWMNEWMHRECMTWCGIWFSLLVTISKQFNAIPFHPTFLQEIWLHMFYKLHKSPPKNPSTQWKWIPQGVTMPSIQTRRKEDSSWITSLQSVSSMDSFLSNGTKWDGSHSMLRECNRILHKRTTPLPS